jgi:DNA helicase HerA-like ATPase
MPENLQIFVGNTPSGTGVSLTPAMANRHGLIAGATGTGKTVTLQNLAQEFSQLGVPVFTADVKGDLAGISKQGEPGSKILERIRLLKLEDSYEPAACPTVFWDLYGERGHPIRTTISEMGPLILGRLLDLNDVAQGVLEMGFRIADDQGLLLLDMKDLRSLLTAMADHASELTTTYGNVSKTTVGALQRKLASLDDAGASKFFGEPAIDIKDLFKTDSHGQGYINVLDATKLLADQRLYSTFLLWLLSELFEKLDEVGDKEKPKLVFFFDEAHLLFKDAPKSLVDKIEQVVRLIRSKGVGVYFVTQSPLDIPERVLSQLGNRVQHALRAFTPKDQAAVKTAAQTFRANPKLKTEQVIMELGVGEALVSVLDGQGSPTVVERVFCCPPESFIGPITDTERKALIEGSPVYGKYEDAIDRESAFEILLKRKGALLSGTKAGQPGAPTEDGGIMGKVESVLSGVLGSGSGSGRRQSGTEAFTKSILRSMGSRVGTQIARGLLGSIFGGSKGR